MQSAVSLPSASAFAECSSVQLHLKTSVDQLALAGTKSLGLALCHGPNTPLSSETMNQKLCLPNIHQQRLKEIAKVTILSFQLLE